MLNYSFVALIQILSIRLKFALPFQKAEKHANPNIRSG